MMSLMSPHRGSRIKSEARKMLCPTSACTFCWPHLVCARSIHRTRKGFCSEILATTNQFVSVAGFSGKDWLLQKVTTQFWNPCSPPLPTRGKGTELCGLKTARNPLIPWAKSYVKLLYEQGLQKVLHWKHNRTPTRSRERTFHQRQFVGEKNTS